MKPHSDLKRRFPMMLTPGQQDAITIGTFLLLLAAGIYIWPPERLQSADKSRDNALEDRAPASTESVRHWNRWLDHCQKKPDCRRRLDELMSNTDDSLRACLGIGENSRS